jgi:hypothetical protein
LRRSSDQGHPGCDGEKENKRWQKTTSCPSRRTNIRSCAAQPATPFLASLTTSPTLVPATGFACIGANAARACGKSKDAGEGDELSHAGTFTESKFRHGKITIMEDEPTMESVLRRLREIVADSKDLPDAPDPKALPEEIERAIRE